MLKHLCCTLVNTIGKLWEFWTEKTRRIKMGHEMGPIINGHIKMGILGLSYNPTYRDYIIPFNN